MSRSKKLRFLVATAVATLVLATCSGQAAAQFLLRYTSDDLSEKILDSLLLVDETVEAIDGNHLTIAGWLFSAARVTLDDAKTELPGTAFQRRIEKAGAYLVEKKPKKAIANLKRGSEELQEMARFWDVQAAQARLAELTELLERGEAETCRKGLGELLALARIEPLQKFLDEASTNIRDGKKKLSKRLAMESVENSGKAAYGLRRAYLSAKLTQVKVIVVHTRFFIGKNRRWKARLALWRGARKLREGRYLATEAEIDAIEKIGLDIKEAQKMMRRKDRGADAKLGEIEAKINAMLDKMGD